MESEPNSTAHTLAEEQRILEVLTRTGTALAAELDMERLVKIVTDAGVEVSGAAFGAFFYNKTDVRGDTYMLYTLSGAPREAFEKFPLPSKTKLFGPTFHGEGIIRSDDITKDPRYGHNEPYRGMPPGHLEVRSYLAVPVISRSRGVIGGLFFGHPKPGVFKEHTELNIAGLAAQAAIAFDNASLYQAVHLSERRFRALIENSADGIAVFDATNKAIYFSPSVTSIEGFTLGEISYRQRIENIHPEDIPLMQAAIAWVLENPGKPRHALWRRKHKDGHWMWLEGTATNLLDDPAVGGIVTNYRDVTQRITAERALRESEAKFAAAFRSSPIAITITDSIGKFVEVNEAYCKLCGYSREELIGRRVTDTSIVLEPDREQLIARARKEGPWESSIELKTHRRDGEIRDVIYSVMNVSLDGVPHRITIGQDITERKRAEDSVQRLNRTYAVLSDINQLIVRDLDEQNILDNACRIAVNKGQFLLAWIGLEKAAAMPLQLVAHAGATTDTLEILNTLLTDPETGCAFTAQAFTSGAPSVCNDIQLDPLAAPWREAALRRGYRSMASFPLALENKCWGTFNLYAPTPQFFDADEQTLLSELARDIAFALGSCARERERIHAQDELRRNEERFRALIEGASDLITVVDAHGVIRYVSPSVRQLLGYSPDEVLLHKAEEFVHADDRTIVISSMQRALNAPLTSIPVEYRIAHRDGTWRRMHSLGRSLPDESPDGFIVFNSRDVTERHLLEQQLAQSQKMQAIGTLAGGIAHDFNNILSAIVGNAEMARLDLGPTHPALLSIKEIQRASQRAKELVQRILSFSRPQEQRLQSIQLQAPIEEAVRLLRSTIPAGVVLNLDCVPKLPAVRADASQIHQVVLNLVTNAWHAIGNANGRIDIRLAQSRVDSTLSQSHPELQPGPYVRLSVSDTGSGMDAATQERIFDPFFTTKPPGQGAGLGLSVVHGIARSHGGAVIVESELGKGSTFHLYFPVSAEDVAAVTPADSRIAARGNGERIMYVDDEEALVSLGVQLLTRLGYQVAGFTGPAQALAAFRQSPQDFDAAITDFNMPGMSGVALAEELLRIRPDLPIALSSGYLRAEEIERTRTAGIREIILKPNSMEDLGPLVHRLLTTPKTV